MPPINVDYDFFTIVLLFFSSLLITAHALYIFKYLYIVCPIKVGKFSNSTKLQVQEILVCYDEMNMQVRVNVNVEIS